MGRRSRTNAEGGGNARLRAQIARLETDKAELVEELARVSGFFFKTYCAGIGIDEADFAGPLSSEPWEDVRTNVQHWMGLGGGL